MKTNVQDLGRVRQAEAAGRMSRGDLERAAALAPCEGRASRKGGSRGDAPPSLTGGERVKGTSDTAKTEAVCLEIKPRLVERLVLTATGEVKLTLRRHGLAGDTAFVDWVNFTVDASAFEWDKTSVDCSEEQLVLDASLRLEGILGFGLTRQLPNGRNFYQRAYELGADGWGFLAIGGQRGTVMVSLSGSGCAAAREGWERRLHDWLQSVAGSGRARLTRVDAARDVFDGSYTVDQAKQDYVDGGADCMGRMPVCEQRGDWYRPNGSGRTFYIGKRTNGKFCRVYEKGKALGDAKSEWVRVEVEFKSVDRVLPFDLLLNPGQYLAGAYPMFEWIKDTACRIACVKNAVEATYKSTVVWLKRQCGKALAFVAEMEGGAQAALDLVGVKGRVPVRIDRAAPDISQAGVPVHKQERFVLPLDVRIDMSIAAM